MSKDAGFEGKSVELVSFALGFRGVEERKVEGVREVLVEGIRWC